jgi:hypothetical protein
MKTQFVTDKKGKKIAVLIPLKEYERMLEELDELECIRVYDKVMESQPEYVPASKVFSAIEKKRKRR